MLTESEQQGRDISNLRVLVAEDVAVNALLLRKMLGIWQIVPTVVGNGKEAVQAIINHEFDVVLMDINMPVMDGFEAARVIRALTDRKKANIPIIAVTAFGWNAVAEHSDFRHLDDVIWKPLVIKTLKLKLQALDTYFTIRSRQSEN